MLAQDALEEASQQASEIRELSLRFQAGRSYYGLWYLHTRVKWLLRTNQTDEALRTAEDALPHVERLANRNLLVRMQLIAAEALGACGRPLDGATLLATALHQSPDPALDIVAEAARVAGCLAVDDRGAAHNHFARAIRIFDALGHRTARDYTRRLAGGGQSIERQPARPGPPRPRPGPSRRRPRSPTWPSILRCSAPRR